MKILEGAMQVLLDLRIRVDLTVTEDTRRHLIDVVRCRDRLEIRLLIIDEPFFHVLSFRFLVYISNLATVQAGSSLTELLRNLISIA